MNGSVIVTILIGVVLVVVGFAHPIGPGLFLAAETPFDAIPFKLFDVVGNLITFVPIVILLVKVAPNHWGQIFLGTRIQQYIALFILALLISHAQGVVDPNRGLGEIFEWLRKLTLFTVLGVFAFAMRSTRHLPLLAKTMVFAMALFTFLSMLDFYMGIQVMPLKAGSLETAAFDTEYQSYLATDWRFTGAGYPVNRFSNYLLLVIFLGVGWFMYARGPIQRAVALGCTSLLVIAELLTITRSGILGMLVGMILLMPMAIRFRLQQVIGVMVVGGLVAALAWYAVLFTSGGEVLATRFETGQVANATGGRIERILAALTIWAEHPFLGVGWGFFRDHSHEYISGTGTGAHNGYLRVLAEAGLIGFIPMMVVTVAVIRRNLVRVGHLSAELEFWRPYFFCGLVAQLVTNVFNDYFWERYLWVSFAFTVALENCYHAARAQQFRTRFDAEPSPGEGSAPEPFAARVRTP